MRCVHELVATVLVARAAVVLHQLADDGALGVPDGQAAAEFTRETEEVEFGGELAVVALGRLLQLVKVLGKRLLGLPGRAVDALQHRALLVAAPVGARDALELEEAELAGRRDVRTDAHVDEAVGVSIGADHAALADFGGVVVVGCSGSLKRRLDAFDDLDLVGLVGEEFLGLVHRHLGADERLVRLDDLAHLGLDARQVVVAERLGVGQLEVVVEAVLDGRADRELRAGEQPGDRLRHHVGRRVAQHMTSLGRAGRDDRNGGAVAQRRGEVGLLSVDDGGDGRLLEAGADGGGQVECGGVVGQFALGAVGERDRDVRHATVRIGAAATVRRVGWRAGVRWR